VTTTDPARPVVITNVARRLGDDESAEWVHQWLEHNLAHRIETTTATNTTAPVPTADLIPPMSDPTDAPGDVQAWLARAPNRFGRDWRPGGQNGDWASLPGMLWEHVDRMVCQFCDERSASLLQYNICAHCGWRTAECRCLSCRYTELSDFRRLIGHLDPPTWDLYESPDENDPDDNDDYDGPDDDDGRLVDVDDYHSIEDWYPLGEGPLYVGAEVEICGRNGLDIGSAVASLSSPVWAGATEDGSLCEYSAECITHPISLDAWQTDTVRSGIDQFFEALGNAGAAHTCCGTHFHLSTKGLGAVGVWGLLYLHDRLQDYLGELGGRGTRASAGSFGNSPRATAEMARSKVRYDDQDGSYLGVERYSAVNLSKHGTVELRYMAGVSDADTFVMRWELAHALGTYARRIPYEAIAQPMGEVWAGFVRFVIGAEDDYPTLRAELKARFPECV